MPHLDYSDIIYEEAYNAHFHQKFETFQFNACLAMPGAIRVTSRENLKDTTGEKHRQIKFQGLQKVGIWAFGSLVHQISSSKEVLKMKQNFQEK